jgi:large subunit ribosomal protein L19
MSNIVQQIEAEQTGGAAAPRFRAGATVRVHVRIKEGQKERIQVFEGVVIAYKANGLRSTMTVRKVSYGVGVERIFPLYSPTLEKVEWMRRGKVRRAKLYYLRDLRGKKARLSEVRNAADPTTQAAN